MSREPNGEERWLDAAGAAAWLIAKQVGDPEADAAFAQWLLDSPRHVREALLVAALDFELSRVDPRLSIDSDQPEQR